MASRFSWSWMRTTASFWSGRKRTERAFFYLIAVVSEFYPYLLGNNEVSACAVQTAAHRTMMSSVPKGIGDFFYVAVGLDKRGLGERNRS